MSPVARSCQVSQWICRPSPRSSSTALLALREVRGEAARRDAIDAEMRNIAVEIGRLPAVTTADPQAEIAARLARWLTAGLAPITPDDVAMARIAGMALLPQIGGMVMMLATALFRRVQVRQPHRTPIES
jgi:hypothetical protein